MLKKIKKIARDHLTNSRGWRTDRKIIVIESDDWGAIRLPKASLLHKLSDWGIKTENDPMLRNDAMASEEDLEALFNTLRGVREKGSPVLTANTIVANPDFKRIEADGFQQYYYEPFTDTLAEYPSHTNAFGLWKKGMEEGLFHPQFHGREHLHVSRWMKGLQNRTSETARLFDERIYAVCGSASTETRKSFLAAYEWDIEGDRTFTAQSIREGLQLFESIFGYSSKTAIAPNYTWNKELEQVYAEGGVKYLQGSTAQRSPDIGTEGNKLIRHYMGEKNELNQFYLVRNCRFEPTLDPDIDNVARCLEQISTAFLWKKPAIIESHRVNYIGYIDPKTRDKNLKLLDILLRKTVEKWPDVEFMTSDRLGELMDESL
ncbi:hypothetical protein [Rhodohalobacter barkolensis]|uniref:Polysaccharide (De)acetylase n=1 Tax=Rhodohalobacter barkolensis TaxID=2053187 RepID=A0A2N0VGD5_9BACT|nr:hypothetical protein [Rhodohalobacter barkolensis]PKD43265.1 hypothetical protein CWD77_11665 [Rhodohalobacter barkolensis]